MAVGGENLATCFFLGGVFSCSGVFDAHALFPGGGGGVLGISSDGDDRRIFLGLKFSIPGFFWVRKFGKYFFG